VVSDRAQQQGVDGGDGSASVQVTSDEEALLNQMAARTMSDPGADPLTGAELGMGMADGSVR
jgi:Mn-containing catalase